MVEVDVRHWSHRHHHMSAVLVLLCSYVENSMEQKEYASANHNVYN